MRKIDDQLKAAIAQLSAKEKDKLLFRLIAKDEKLVRKLVFELIEGGTTRDDRAAELRQQIAEKLPETGQKWLTPGLLMMELRFWNARISEHVAATKDKPGEVSLTFFMLAEALRRHRHLIVESSARRVQKFAPYVVKRVASLLPKARRLHEDYFIEFRRDADEVLAFIWAYAPMVAYAQEAQLPRRFDP
jgi:hypothetical protein